jgi:hypothetical protein
MVFLHEQPRLRRQAIGEAPELPGTPAKAAQSGQRIARHLQDRHLRAEFEGVTGFASVATWQAMIAHTARTH